MGGADSPTPAPEGVVVLGMHRSGTSLITRLVSLLGLAVCRRDDLLVGRALNPRGHWESKSLLHFNDRLLRELGRTWFCPPVLDSKDVTMLLRRHATGALSTLGDAHPERPWVWKDPRTCILMPFWSAVLEQRAAYVLVVRHPFEVSDSLAHRNGFTPLLSLALWERYTRQAMLGAAGRPLMVCTYDDVLADPVAWCERLVDFTSELGFATRPVDPVAIGAFAMDGLRHSRQSWRTLQPGPDISQEQVALAAAASTFTVQRSYVPPTLPAETPETDSIFREIAGRRRSRRKLTGLPAHLADTKSRPVGTGDPSRPPVSVVVAVAGDSAAETSVANLAATLPAGSEMLLVGANHSRHADDSSRPVEISLRHIDRESSSSEAEAFALGIESASGRVVLLSTSGLLRCDSWYEPVTEALGLPGIGGVGAVTRFSSSPDTRYFGRAFTDEDLTSRFIPGQSTETLAPAALLAEAHCAFNMALLVAAGGIDRGFDSARAAVAELSLRLWRMGFRTCIVPQVEAWAAGSDGDVADEGGDLYDRMRIAALHLGGVRLQAFNDRVRSLPSCEEAIERLAASDVELRRREIEAVCAFPVDRYFENFPLRPVTLQG